MSILTKNRFPKTNHYQETLSILSLNLISISFYSLLEYYIFQLGNISVQEKIIKIPEMF